MESKEYQVLELLAKHEEKVGELYSVYASKFQEYNEFWSILSEEESTHAKWIRDFANMIKSGTVYFNKRFNVEAINSSLAELNGEIIKAKNDELTLINALSTAYYFEIALIERKFFEVFEGDSVELKHLLIDLSKATIKHQKKTKKAFEKERRKKRF